ncbi:MAG: AAA family ATPase, partial [bacterium]
EQNRLKDEVVELEQVFNRALARLDEANSRLTGTQSRLELHQAATRAQEEQLLNRRQEEEKIRGELRRLLEEQVKHREAVVRLEAEVENSRSAQKRVVEEEGRIGEQLVQMEAELQGQEAEMKRLSAEAERKRQKVSSQRQRLGEIEKRLEELRCGRQRFLEQKGLIGQEIAGLGARLARAEVKLAQAFFGEEWVKAVSRFIVVRPGWERACEAALYFLVDFFAGVAADLVEFERLLREAPGSRFGFLLGCDDVLLTGEPVVIEGDERILGRLADFVEVGADAPVLLKEVVGSFQVVKDNGTLFEVIREKPRARLVTQAGFAYFGDSRLVLAGEEAGTIKTEAKLREQEARLLVLEQELKVLNEEETKARKLRTEIVSELDKAESQLALIEREFYALESRMKTAIAIATELKRERARLIAEQKRLADFRQKMETELGREKEQVAALERDIEKYQVEIDSTEKQLGAIEAKVKAGLRQATEVLAELAEERAQIQRLEVEVEHLKGSVEERRRRIAELEGIISQTQEKVGLIQAGQKGRQEELERLQAQVMEVEAELARYNVLEVSGAAEALERNLAEMRQKQQEAQELLFRRRLERAELEAKIRGLIEEAKSLGADETFFSELTQGQDEKRSAVDVQRLQQVRQRLNALGPVNPLAAEEYQQEQKDLDRLLFQRDDVLQAKENLEESLKEIDRHARDQFLETYEQVRHHFQQVFKELFLEGEADLILMNGSNPLESEVAIIAKPQGKNPKRLEQLSDGEKALLAVSLLFAFYQVKPAPFCFLDEIDAPLDDVNVVRFAEYLKGLTNKTQVIIITHNRATVEHADVIFGVTSEQPGISKLISVSLSDYRAKAARPGAEV